MNDLSIPAIYQGAVMGEHCAAALEGIPPPKVQVYFGPSGTGKSHDACAAAQAYIANRRAWRNTPDAKFGFIVGYSAFINVSRLAALDEEQLRYLEEAAILIIDDIGVRGTEAVIERIYRLTEYACSQNHRLIITGNLTDEIVEALGDRTRSRMAQGLKLNYKGLPDRRRL